MAVWWGTWAECAVTISRLKRDGHLNEESERETRVALDGLTADWAEIEPEDDMRLLAALLSKDYPLKTADALQLAAAVRWDALPVGFSSPSPVGNSLHSLSGSRKGIRGSQKRKLYRRLILGSAKGIYVGGTLISILLSLYLYVSGRRETGIFVGLWAPTVLNLGQTLLEGEETSAERLPWWKSISR
jgi:hypothetical protein